jgi:hypothetical protein
LVTAETTDTTTATTETWAANGTVVTALRDMTKATGKSPGRAAVKRAFRVGRPAA